MTKRRKTAKDFGDNPKIRRKYGEAKRINLSEPWERQYWHVKKEVAHVDSYFRTVNGKRVKVKRHVRHLNF